MVSNDRKKKEVKTDLHFDDGFPDGVFVIPRPLNQPRVKLRALFEFCKKNNVAPSELTKEQMEEFLE